MIIYLPSRHIGDPERQKVELFEYNMPGNGINAVAGKLHFCTPNGPP